MTSPLVHRDRDTGARLSLRTLPLILMYHAVAEVSEDPNKLAVTPARFAEQMAWLAARGLRGVGVAELTDAVRASQHSGGVRGVAPPSQHSGGVRGVAPPNQHGLVGIP